MAVTTPRPRPGRAASADGTGAATSVYDAPRRSL
jgi:hypothetical protein